MMGVYHDFFDVDLAKMIEDERDQRLSKDG
jgi:hypothetical protein